MSNGTAPIETAPVPPSIAGIPQPVFAGGSATNPPTPINITGSPIIPPPTIGDPEGFPVFPPVSPDTAPVPVPVGPLVGPAVPAAPVPPSVAGFPQPTFVPPGSGTVPTAASLFPAFTAAGPFQPIVMVTAAPPPPIPLPLPTTPGQNPPPVVISTAPNIPQLPWKPVPVPPPVNTVRPTITPINDLVVGSALALTSGTWTGTGGTITYARQWLRNGSPIAGATLPGYTLTTADIGAEISGIVTAMDSNGEASAEALPVGPVEALPPPSNTVAPAITGGTVMGDVLTRTTGTWTPTTPTPTYTTQWQRGTTNIAGATAATYTTVVADEGQTIRCIVTATNPSGADQAISNVIGPITATLAADEEEETVNPQRSQEPQAKHRSHHAKPHKKR